MGRAAGAVWWSVSVVALTSLIYYAFCEQPEHSGLSGVVLDNYRAGQAHFFNGVSRLWISLAGAKVPPPLTLSGFSQDVITIYVTIALQASYAYVTNNSRRTPKTPHRLFSNLKSQIASILWPVVLIISHFSKKFFFSKQFYSNNISTLILGMIALMVLVHINELTSYLTCLTQPVKKITFIALSDDVAIILGCLSVLLLYLIISLNFVVIATWLWTARREVILVLGGIAALATIATWTGLQPQTDFFRELGTDALWAIGKLTLALIFFLTVVFLLVFLPKILTFLWFAFKRLSFFFTLAVFGVTGATLLGVPMISCG